MPKSKVLSFAFLLLLLVQSLFLSASSSTPHIDDDDDDLEGLEELLAIDEEEERQGGAAQAVSSETEVLSRAQKIVLQLNHDSAKKVIDGNEFVMVLGYTPWCPRSAELMPRYAEAALALKEMGSPLVMAKIDAERYPKVASQLGIQGYPTILLFVNGSAQSYGGGFTPEEIVVWARKKTGVPVIRLSSISAAEEFLKKHQIFVIGLFENYEGLQYKEFMKAASTEDEIQFVEAKDISIARVLFPDITPKNNFLGLVKSEPERFESFEEDFEEEKILQFVQHYKFPLVTLLTDLNSARVYSSSIKLQVFLFAEADEFKHLQLLLQNVARKFKTKMLFVYVDSAEDDLAKPFLTLFGLESEKPTVTAFDNRIGSKFLLESDLTPSNLEEFCSGLLHGTLSPYFRSEPEPDANGLIQKVVGRTFSAFVLESAENIFLEVHTPWCIDCEETSKRIEKLAKHFKGVDNVKFGRIDASLNEHPNLQVNNYPTLLFYASGDKLNPVKISKKSSLNRLVAFIEEKMELADGRILENDLAKDEL